MTQLRVLPGLGGDDDADPSGSIEGRVAIVTGAGQGVGKGIALALGRAGATVIVASRRAENGEPVAEEIEGIGGVAICVPTDVTDRESVQSVVLIAIERFGSLDVMVHNAFAGGGAPTPLQNATPDQWARQSKTAMWGSVYCAQSAHAHLRPGRGRFIVVASAAGIEGSANLPLYAAVKAGQRGFVKALAREWGSEGVTVNCIAPVAETPALTGAFEANPDLKTRLEARTSLGRVGEPDRDIGPVVTFLASDAARYITGQTIVCDGGSFLL